MLRGEIDLWRDEKKSQEEYIQRPTVIAEDQNGSRKFWSYIKRQVKRSSWMIFATKWWITFILNCQFTSDFGLRNAEPLSTNCLSISNNETSGFLCCLYKETSGWLWHNKSQWAWWPTCSTYQDSLIWNFIPIWTSLLYHTPSTAHTMRFEMRSSFKKGDRDKETGELNMHTL